MSVGTATSKGAKVFIDGEQLEYQLDTTLSTGKASVLTEVDNFRSFYKGLLYANLEGMADLTDEEMQAFREMDDFTNSDKNNPCVLKVTILARDMYGNERNIVYRFYRYSERKAYLTIEVLDSADTTQSNSENAYGTFYVLASFSEKIANDLQKLIEGVEIQSTSKY